MSIHVIRARLDGRLQYLGDIPTQSSFKCHPNLEKAFMFASLERAQNVVDSSGLLGQMHGFEAMTIHALEYGIALDDGPPPKGMESGWHRFKFIMSDGSLTGNEQEAQRWTEFLPCQAELNLRNILQAATLATTKYEMWQWPVFAPVVSTPEPQGCTCKKCNERNEYAEPNQSDGSYICVSCRRYGRPW